MVHRKSDKHFEGSAQSDRPDYEYYSTTSTAPNYYDYTAYPKAKDYLEQAEKDSNLEGVTFEDSSVYKDLSATLTSFNKLVQKKKAVKSDAALDVR